MSEPTTPEVEAPPAPDPTEPPGGAGASPDARRLERIDEGRWLAGVATGIADYFTIPVWLVRVLFILFLGPGGIGLLLYLALIVLMPHEREDRSAADRWFGDLDTGARWGGAILAVVGGIILLGVVGGFDVGMAFAVGLVALGVLLFQGRLPGGPPRTPTSAPTYPDHPDGLGDSSTPGPPPPPPAPKAARPPRPPKPPKEPSHLGPITVAATLLVLGLLGSAHILGWLTPAAVHYAAAALATIGAGLVVGSWLGRSRGLILLGLAVTPFLAASLVFANADRIIDVVATGRVERTVVVDVVDGARTIDAPSGRLVVDLRDTEWPEGGGNVYANLVAGELTLLVPDGVAVVAYVASGEITRDGTVVASGFGVEHRSGNRGDGPTVIAELGIGRIDIQGGSR